ncbi:hypothetical protein [uncultured Serinicoccus sp.]|uniref:hypothetical protein n=1 Tax=uncultured Serinicoccus sp. TaxID=735514 RepID=UPI00262758B2|nr:hypothetical protein [uncultured Serinicoccus sp.]
MPTARLSDDQRDLPDEHDLRSLTLALEAGARGDAVASQAHDLDRTIVLESPARFILQDLIDHGEEAPPWAYSRWCVDLAYRSMLLAKDPRTSARMGAFEVVGLRGCRLVLRSLVDGGTVELLNLGAGCVRGARVIGRPVPISDEPGLMFVRPPMEVDPEAAREVGDAVRSGVPLGWLFGLATALDAGRAAEGFHQVGATTYTSDLPLVVPPPCGRPPARPDEAPRVTELRSRGHSEAVANAVTVLEVGLIAARVSDEAAAGVAPHVMAALSTGVV